MRRHFGKLMMGALVSLGFLSHAGADVMYRVTIKNLTSGQAFSPPVLAFHDEGFAPFTLGKPSSPGIFMLAEDGVQDTLIDEILKGTSNARIKKGSMPIPPGFTMAYRMRAPSAHSVFSAATMLVTTNDGFTGASAVKVEGTVTEFEVGAYDAGSEQNTELCAHIPGEPCGSKGVRVLSDSEGLLTMHPGILGVGDLAQDEFGWRGPVARIRIEMVD